MVACRSGATEGSFLYGGSTHRLRREAAEFNKGMKLTKLSAAPFHGKKCRLMPAPVGLDAGTASQLIRSVGPTFRNREGREATVA
jgi:hypothetical protein